MAKLRAKFKLDIDETGKTTRIIMNLSTGNKYHFFANPEGATAIQESKNGLEYLIRKDKIEDVKKQLASKRLYLSEREGTIKIDGIEYLDGYIGKENFDESPNRISDFSNFELPERKLAPTATASESDEFFGF